MNSQLNEGVMVTEAAELTLPEGCKQGQLLYRVHFRIDTPSYHSNKGLGFHNDEDKKHFADAASAFLAEQGFEPERGPYMTKGGFSRLYMHPDEFSGEVTMEDIHLIHEALDDHDNVFKSRKWTDVLEAYEVISIPELTRRLVLFKEDIKDIISQRFVTTRKDKYWPVSAWAGYAMELPAFRLHTSKRKNPVIESQYRHLTQGVLKIVDEMVKQGTFKRLENEQGKRFYRSANKTEQKALAAKEKSSTTTLAM